MSRASAGSCAVVVAIALVTAGCDIGLGGSVTVVNRTDQTLTIDGYELQPRTGSWQYGIQGCGQRALEILDAAGDEYAEIDPGWCEGELWTITGPDEVSIEKDAE